MGGDFQNTPEQFQEFDDWLRRVKGCVYAPAPGSVPTEKKGRTIDYFVGSEALAHMVVAVLPLADFQCRSHRPVKLIVDGNQADKVPLEPVRREPRAFPRSAPQQPCR